MKVIPLDRRARCADRERSVCRPAAVGASLLASFWVPWEFTDDGPESFSLDPPSPIWTFSNNRLSTGGVGKVDELFAHRDSSSLRGCRDR
jgi:hypothetical protein